MKACYIHVPFCNSICAYCDFVRCKYQTGLVNKWLDRVELDIADLHVDELKTIYIGGGTPSALNENQLTRILQAILPYTKTVEEYTIEANPDSLTEEKINILIQNNVNRLSLGVQTFQDDLQNIIQRKHTLTEIKQLINLVREKGIKNISIDLMYGLPTQTMDAWKKDLEIAVSLPIEHISLYALTIEEHSEFGRKHVQNMDSQMEADMYEFAIDYLSKHGYEQYEISNFALKNYESRHNQMYWNYQDFVGIGCGASGKEHHSRYDNTSNLHTYITAGASPEVLELSKKDEMFETVMMGLRMKKGLSLTRFEETYHVDFESYFSKAIQKNINNHFLIIEDGYIKTTYQGMLLLNSVLLDFL